MKWDVECDDIGRIFKSASVVFLFGTFRSGDMKIRPWGGSSGHQGCGGRG